MTLSRKRTAVAVERLEPRLVEAAPSAVNGLSISRARLIEPSRQAPCGGNGCSPQGLVALIVLAVGEVVLRR